MEFTKGPENATDVWTPEALGRDTFEPGKSILTLMTGFVAG